MGTARAKLKANNGASAQQSASQMHKLVSEHQNEVHINQNETLRSQVTRGALWKGATTNMRLVQEIHEHNKKVDCFQRLIANKSQHRHDEHKAQADTRTPTVANASISASGATTCKKHEDAGTAHELFDPRQMYAAQLVAKNKRYEEILALLRKKVDMLRAHRKNTI